MSDSEAFVTLATNESYALGAIVLARSLRQVGTTRQLALMITATAGISDTLRQQIECLFDVITVVDVMDSNDAANLELLTRPDLGVTFTKLNCWKLTQFNKCVFMDADTLVLQNIDDLFEREEFSAAPDIGWPDCFNSGVFVYRPSLETFRALVHFAITNGSFDGGDQGLLNSYFSDWATKDIKKRLPFIYNVVSQAFYSYRPAMKQYGNDAKVIHFIGAVKPWHLTFNTSTQSVDLSGVSADSSHSHELLNLWWRTFMSAVRPNLDMSTICLSRDLDSLTIVHSRPSALLDDNQRQYNWEKGCADYLGADSFDNIQKQIEAKLQKTVGTAGASEAGAGPTSK